MEYSKVEKMARVAESGDLCAFQKEFQAIPLEERVAAMNAIEKQSESDYVRKGLPVVEFHNSADSQNLKSELVERAVVPKRVLKIYDGEAGTTSCVSKMDLR